MQDRNLDALAAAADRAGVEVFPVRIRSEQPPTFEWTLGEMHIKVDGKPIEPTAAFLRHDVFDWIASGRSEVADQAFAWFVSIAGWCGSQPAVRTFNRHARLTATNKLAVLAAAVDVGLCVPATCATNSQTRVRAQIESAIVKPVGGGTYCETAAMALKTTEWREGLAPAPALLQSRLDYPEYRIYVVRDDTIGFKIHSEVLDYRRDRRATIVLTNDIPKSVSVGLVELAHRCGIDFGAADFKTHPDTGTLVFLELNTSPMFAAFDAVASGQLTDTMVAALMAPTDGRLRSQSGTQSRNIESKTD